MIDPTPNEQAAMAAGGDAAGGYLVDFQVPIARITARSDGGVVTATTPVQFFVGSSQAANLAVIEGDGELEEGLLGLLGLLDGSMPIWVGSETLLGLLLGSIPTWVGSEYMGFRMCTPVPNHCLFRSFGHY